MRRLLVDRAVVDPGLSRRGTEPVGGAAMRMPVAVPPPRSLGERRDRLSRLDVPVRETERA